MQDTKNETVCSSISVQPGIAGQSLELFILARGHVLHKAV